MGPLDDHELRIAYYEQQLATWDAERRELVAAVTEAELARDGIALEHALDRTPPFALDATERVVHVLDDAGLIELDRTLGDAGHRPFCLRVTRDLRWHLGARRSVHLLSPPPPAVALRGEAWITDRRVVFHADDRTVEWTLTDLDGVEHLTTSPATLLQSRGCGRASGVAYDAYTAGAFRLRLAIAMAVADGTEDRLVKSLREELAEHEEKRPAPPRATAAAVRRLR